MSSPAISKNPINVPWYDSNEWIYIHNLLFTSDNDVNSYKKALVIIKIWKERMPRLPAAIEGTLIILNGILSEYEAYPDDVKRQLQAAAVMRFLNICVVNGSRTMQESLFQIARLKNLPDWLINLRHDFAHSQNIPSREMLEYGMDLCFDWIKINYWKAQIKTIQNFCCESNDDQEEIKNLIELYGEIALLKDRKKKSTDIRQRLKALKIERVKDRDDADFMTLQAIVRRLIAKKRNLNVHIEEIFIRGGLLFQIEEFSHEHIKYWLPIFGVLHLYNGFLSLMLQLVEICCNSPKEEAKKAADWLSAIADVLITKNRNYIVPVEDKTFNYKLKNCVDKIIEKPNSCMSVYLEKLLKAARYNQEFIEDVKMGAAAYNGCGNASSKTDKIYSIHDVKELMGEEAFDPPKSTSPWTLVDSSMFDGVPLGKTATSDFHPVLDCLATP